MKKLSHPQLPRIKKYGTLFSKKKEIKEICAVLSFGLILATLAVLPAHATDEFTYNVV